MAKTISLTQKDIVSEKLKDHATQRMTSTTETLTPPGIQTLHQKDISEIADFLANIIKSRRGVTTLTYNVGHSITVTSESDLSV
ncbi:MAG TPA: hypothetical protein VKR58_08490 [Aquella sp.]|nr:hypothetical protein [Aquella sp.]